MFNIGYIIPIVMSCHLLFLELLKYKKEEVSKNIIHFIHGLIFILYHNYRIDMVYITHVSIGFYIYDLIYLFTTVLKFKDKLGQQLPYFIHHIITITILHGSLYNAYFLSILNGYYIFEMSNMMLYISYHIHKEHKNYKLIYVTDFIQLIWYSYYRIIKILVFSYEIIDEILEQKASLCIMLFVIYLMGVSWSYKLVIKNINNFNSYKALKK
jgi:hypothetical protein